MFNRFRTFVGSDKFKAGFEFVSYSFMGFTVLDYVGNKFVFATICSGPSMEPTISKSGDGVIVRCTDNFDIGDIVVAKCPTDSKKRKYQCCSIYLPY